MLVEARKSITGVIININKLIKIIYNPNLNTKLSTKLLFNKILFCLYRIFVILESRIIKSRIIESDSKLRALLIKTLLRDLLVNLF